MSDELTTETIERGQLLAKLAKTFMVHQALSAQLIAYEQSRDEVFDEESLMGIEAHIRKAIIRGARKAKMNIRNETIELIGELARLGEPNAMTAMQAYATVDTEI